MLTIHELMRKSIGANELMVSLNNDIPEGSNFIGIAKNGDIIAGAFGWEDDRDGMKEVLDNLTIAFAAKDVEVYITIMSVQHRETGKEAVMFAAADRQGNKLCKVRYINRDADGRIVLGHEKDDTAGNVMCTLLDVSPMPQELKEKVNGVLDAHVIQAVQQDLYGGQKPVLH